MTMSRWCASALAACLYFCTHLGLAQTAPPAPAGPPDAVPSSGLSPVTPSASPPPAAAAASLPASTLIPHEPGAAVGAGTSAAPQPSAVPEPTPQAAPGSQGSTKRAPVAEVPEAAWLAGRAAHVAAFRRVGHTQLRDQARKWTAKREYAQALRLQATAYLLQENTATRIEMARSARGGELDADAFIIYSSLRKETSEEASPEEIEDELRSLRIKLDDGDEDLRVAQAVRRHLDQAKRRYQSGQYDTAAGEYALAYVLRPLPRVLFNVAQAQRRAGHPEEAALLYLRFVQEDPDSPYRREALGYLTELKRIAFVFPLSRRPWFWVVIGTGIAALAATVAGIAVAAQPRLPPTDGGTQVLHFSLSH